MARPLMQHGVGQLEEMFTKSRTEQKVLLQLEHELQYRQVPRAVALLAEVRAAMNGARASPPAAPALHPAAAPQAIAHQPELWDRLAQPPAAVARPPATPAPMARTSPSPPPNRPVPAAPTIPLDDAYKLLKSVPGSGWESIERSRRLLVQASHPERVKRLSANKRSEALTEAKRINEAYAAVSQARCAGR